MRYPVALFAFKLAPMPAIRETGDSPRSGTHPFFPSGEGIRIASLAEKCQLSALMDSPLRLRPLREPTSGIDHGCTRCRIGWAAACSES